MSGRCEGGRAGSAPRGEYFCQQERWGSGLGVLVFWLVWASGAVAQGFAGMGEAGDGFAEVVPGYQFEFPADHGAHERFRIEWWYVTANLRGEDGRDYGIQWTLFRNAMRAEVGTGWESNQLWMGHAALTTPEQHYFGEKFARGGVGQAGVTADPFEAWIDDWVLDGPFDALSAKASGGGFSYDLNLTSDAPIVFQGENGFSIKSESGKASYYYSQPFYRVTGSVTAEGQEIAVTGQAWLDREWSTQPLEGAQAGWDWFSLHLDGGEKVMLARVRQEGSPDFHAGTWIAADGTSQNLQDRKIALTPLEFHETAGVDLPVRWRLEVPSKGLNVEVEAMNRDSYMTTLFPYWEGPVAVSGSHGGMGYLEMTGYGAERP